MWSENYAFMTCDRGNRLSIMTLLGRWSRDPRTWREFLVLGLPNERIAYYKSFGRATQGDVACASMLRVEILQPGRAFRLLYDGPVAESTSSDLATNGGIDRPVRRCQMDLRYEAVSPVWDMSGDAGAATEVAGRLHVEQVGVANGIVSVGEQEFRLKDAFIQRDHSRGVRIVKSFKRHCWAQGYLPEPGMTFNVYHMEVHGASGASMSNATVSKGPQRYPARVISMPLMEHRQDGHKRYEFVLESELGRMRIKTREIITTLPVSFTSPWDIHAGVIRHVHSAAAFEEAVIWEMDSWVGSGWSERAFNASPFPE